ncbi:MAG: hypothetical protein ACREVP_04680 [Burkholderiales bacterium]
MRLDVAALALTAGILWGAVMLVVASANLVWPSYGGAFLELVASIYPGYQPGAGVRSVIIGTLYAIVDGGVGGGVFAWIYNLFARRRGH